jgi:hypothetical protein
MTMDSDLLTYIAPGGLIPVQAESFVALINYNAIISLQVLYCVVLSYGAM